MITNFTLTCSDCLFAISSDVSFSKNSNEIDIEKNPKISNHSRSPSKRRKILPSKFNNVHCTYYFQNACQLVKICFVDGKYGFSEPFQFNSVTELVEFYQRESLKEYNKDLDTRLLYPVSRFTQEADVDVDETSLAAESGGVVDTDKVLLVVSRRELKKTVHSKSKITPFPTNQI